MDYGKLSLPIGEAIFTQRAVRRFKRDPIPPDVLHLLIEAAVRAPNGINRQIARFLILTDRARIEEFGDLYREAWWAKRRDEGHAWKTRDEIPAHEKIHRSAAALADHMRDVPCVVFALGANNGPTHSVVPASQNLMIAARALGIGSVPTTLHSTVMDCFREMFSIPKDVAFHFCIPLGYPAEEKFGGSVRRPTSETTYLDRWGSPVSWEWLARQSRPDAAFG
jgi:nitroreductase